LQRDDDDDADYDGYDDASLKVCVEFLKRHVAKANKVVSTRICMSVSGSHANDQNNYMKRQFVFFPLFSISVCFFFSSSYLQQK